MTVVEEKGNPGEQLAAEAVRGLPPVLPAAAYRERLRAEFLAGSLRSPVIRSPGGVEPGALDRLRGWLRSRPWVWIPAMAAAALALVVFVRSGEEPAWRFVGSMGEGSVLVNGHPVPIAQLEDAVEPGSEIRVSASLQVDLALGETLFLQGAPGSAFSVPEIEGRGDLLATISDGEIRFATGPGFSGRRLRVLSPWATAEVVGTTLAVLCGADSTCVCVLDGEVRMVSATGQAERVGAGFRRTVFRSERAPRQEPILSMETMKLSMLRDRADSLLAGER